MGIPLYQIDTFTDTLFCGNPAAICPLEKWLPDLTMQAIAAENNLSETAFFVAEDNGYRIRWFTPTTEIDLCGHATLATAYVLFQHLNYPHDTIAFTSRSGVLKATRKDDAIVLDFPLQQPLPCDTPKPIAEAFSSKITACYKAEDYILLFKNEADIQKAEPDLYLLKTVDLRGVIITAQTKQYDFVVRFFAPKQGIDEDPVTGSAYTQLAPLWAKKLGKNKLYAKQLSSRGGKITCETVGNRVYISGQAMLYMQGTVHI